MAMCKVCNNRKKIPGLGMMLAECYNCLGTGQEPNVVLPVTSVAQPTVTPALDDKLKELEEKLAKLEAIEQRLSNIKSDESEDVVENTAAPRRGRPKKEA